MRFRLSPPTPPRRLFVVIVFVVILLAIGGGTPFLAYSVGQIIVQVAPHWALALSGVAMAITLALALGAGLIMSRWWDGFRPRPRTPHGESLVWRVLSVMFLILFGLGLSATLLTLAPIDPSLQFELALLSIPIGLALGLALFGPLLVTTGIWMWRRAHASQARSSPPEPALDASPRVRQPPRPPEPPDLSR